jgi:hypothetical protein
VIATSLNKRRNLLVPSQACREIDTDLASKGANR